MSHPNLTWPTLTWTESDTPVATAFGDPYFTGGMAETQHVFMAGNGLPDRLVAGFHIAELGFGTGLNLLAVAQAWQGPELIKFTSFEAFPLHPTDMDRALAPFQLPFADSLLQAWAAPHGPVRRFRLNAIEVEVHIGDARETLLHWQGRADAWFLDGFAPAKNPELWGDALMADVANHTAPGGTVATYTSAGHVRRALAAAGLTVTREPGFGRKKHMTKARMPQ